jgi:hypothetical protein
MTSFPAVRPRRLSLQAMLCLENHLFGSYPTGQRNITCRHEHLHKFCIIAYIIIKGCTTPSGVANFVLLENLHLVASSRDQKSAEGLHTLQHQSQHLSNRPTHVCTTWLKTFFLLQLQNAITCILQITQNGAVDFRCVVAGKSPHNRAACIHNYFKNVIVTIGIKMQMPFVIVQEYIKNCLCHSITSISRKSALRRLSTSTSASF